MLSSYPSLHPSLWLLLPSSLENPTESVESLSIWRNDRGAGVGCDEDAYKSVDIENVYEG